MSIDVSDERCETCRFYRSKLILDADGKVRPAESESPETPAEYEDNSDETAGYCRRYPPAITQPGFPDVRVDEWCGEYQPRTPLPMAPPA